MSGDSGVNCGDPSRKAFNVRVKLVEPGYGATTRFTNSTGSRMEGLIPEAYAPFARRIFASLTQGPAAVTTESDVAEVVCRAERCVGSSDFRQVSTRWRWLSRDNDDGAGRLL